MQTYGTIEYVEEKDHWKIQCDPDVMIKFKRCFGKSDKNSYGVLKLSATDENCRDIEWFLERYPMVVIGESRLKKGARNHDETVQSTRDILDGHFDYDGSEMALPPREYQKQAAAVTLKTGGLLVADDLGLGKTVTAIATIASPQARPALVVCPAHLQKQWERELNRFLPDAYTHILRTKKTYNLARPDGRLPDVYIITYSKLSGWSEHFGGYIKTTIFDECQELRRRESQKYYAAQYVATRSKFRSGLSSTPIYNYGDEFFNVLDVLHPKKLGTFQEFCREWCNNRYGKNPQIKDPKAFGKYLRTNALMVRRTRKDVGIELPGLNRVVQTVNSDVKALEAVEKGAIELARIILDQSGASKGIDKMMSARELSHTLRQATGIAKAPYVAEFAKMLLESGEKVVLYGWHRAVYDIWSEKLADYNPAWYTGSESPGKKDKEFKRFVGGDTNVMFISLRSGSGLEGLQNVCHTIVVGELDWSPGAIEQCIGRIYRPGQGEPVFVYYLTANDGADPIMTNVLGLKKKQIDPVKDPDGSIVTDNEVDPEHIKKLAHEYLMKVDPVHAKKTVQDFVEIKKLIEC